MSKRSLLPDNTWTIPLIKDELRKLNLPLQGNKTALLERLLSTSSTVDSYPSILNPSQLLLLPDDMFFLILEELESKEIVRVCSVNKDIYKRCKTEKIQKLIKTKKLEEYEAQKWYLYIREYKNTNILSRLPLDEKIVNTLNPLKYMVRVPITDEKIKKDGNIAHYIYYGTEHNIISPIFSKFTNLLDWAKENNIRLGARLGRYDGYLLGEITIIYN